MKSKCVPEIFPVHTPMYMYYNRLKKRAHIRRTEPEIVRPTAELCASGAECTVSFEHCV